MRNKIIIDGEKDKEYNRRIVIDESEDAKLCLDIKNIEDLMKNITTIDECVIHELTFRKVKTINTDFSDIKINTVKFLDSKTWLIGGSFRGCSIEKLVFASGGDDRIRIYDFAFINNNISILDIDRESSDIDIGVNALKNNIIRKVKLKTTGEICIRTGALENNIIRSFIIEGMPKEIEIHNEALENNEIKELKLQATDKIEIRADALIDNPIESIYLDAPNIEVEKEFFNIKTLKVLYMPKNVYNRDYKKYSESLKKYGIKIKFTKGDNKEKIVLTETKQQDKKYKYFPKNKTELVKIIKKLMDEESNNVNLNHIDVSKIKDFSYLFSDDKEKGYELYLFNGDISQWNVSNGENMDYMFSGAKYFNGDVSNWNVSNFKTMLYTFERAKNFNIDISNWDVSNVKLMANIFAGTQYDNPNMCKWNLVSVTDKHRVVLGKYELKKEDYEIEKYTKSSVKITRSQWTDCYKNR